MSRIGALLRLLCPVCRNGQMFSGPLTMNPQCPSCRYVFEREPGYYLGSLVIGYVFGVGFVTALGFAVHAARPSLDWELAFAIGFVLYLGLVPAVFRYSRAIWMAFDNWLDPPGGRSDGF